MTLKTSSGSEIDLMNPDKLYHHLIYELARTGTGIEAGQENQFPIINWKLIFESLVLIRNAFLSKKREVV